MKKLNLKSFVVTFIVFYLVVHFTFWSVRLGDNFSFPNGVRFLFNHTLPLLLVVLLWCAKDVEYVFLNRFWRDIALTLFVTFVCLVNYVIFTSLMFHQPFFSMFNLNWSIQAIIEYYFAMWIFLYILTRKRLSKVEAGLITVSLLFTVGWVYELPIFYLQNPHIGTYYHITHPFVVNGRLIITPFLILYFTRRFHWKPGTKILTMVVSVPYVLFALYYGFKTSLFPGTFLSGWVPRLPTILFSTLLLSRIEKKKMKSDG